MIENVIFIISIKSGNYRSFFPFCFLLYFIVLINGFLDIYVFKFVEISIRVLETNDL